MSLWDKVRTQNRIESELIRDLGDILCRSTGGRIEIGRFFRNGIVILGRLPFLQDPPEDKITREMTLIGVSLCSHSYATGAKNH